MKLLLSTVVLATAISNLVQADTIVIRDSENGRIIAEVDIDAHDSKFSHAGRTLTIERKASTMELRARKLQIPKISFREASLDEVAWWLRQPSPAVDEPSGPRPAVINIVINDQAKRKLLIDLHLEEVSLFDVWASLARKYGLTITYDDRTVTVTDPKRDE
jgi:hypothetical protein